MSVLSVLSKRRDKHQTLSVYKFIEEYDLFYLLPNEQKFPFPYRVSEHSIKAQTGDIIFVEGDNVIFNDRKIAINPNWIGNSNYFVPYDKEYNRNKKLNNLIFYNFYWKTLSTLEIILSLYDNLSKMKQLI